MARKQTFATAEEATRALAEIQAIQFPRAGDIEALRLFNEDVGPGERLTLEFVVSPNFMAHIKRILISFAPDTNYKYIFRGGVFEGDNEAFFTVPQKEFNVVTVIIENLGLTSENYQGRIEGWGSPK